MMSSSSFCASDSCPTSAQHSTFTVNDHLNLSPLEVEVGKNSLVYNCTQGGTGIEKKDPGSVFFFKASSDGLTNLRNQERIHI